MTHHSLSSLISYSDFPPKNVICTSYHWKLSIIQEATTVQTSILQKSIRDHRMSLTQLNNLDVLWSGKSGRVCLSITKKKKQASTYYPTIPIFKIWKKQTLGKRYSLQRHLTATRKKYLQHQRLHWRGCSISKQQAQKYKTEHWDFFLFIQQL